MDPSSLSMADAQRDMRFGYFGGAPGLLASALAWLTAGIFALNSPPKHAIIALFVGGMFIHPVGVFLARILGRPGAHTRGNPLGVLALESTFQLLLGLPLAYGVSFYRAEWFFPAMLLVIGGRYLVFGSLYGLRLYWACGAVLAIAGYLLAVSKASLPLGAFTGAALELVFATLIFAAVRHDSRGST